MHYFDLIDVREQARTYWAMRGHWPLDVYITRTSYVHLLGEQQ
jgi:hypothetical protein